MAAAGRVGSGTVAEGAGGNSREGKAGLLTRLLWELPFTADAWQGRKHLRIC